MTRLSDSLLRAALLLGVVALALHDEWGLPGAWARAVTFLPGLLALVPTLVLLQRRPGWQRQRAFVWAGLFSLFSAAFMVGEAPPPRAELLLFAATVACSRTAGGGLLVGFLGAFLSVSLARGEGEAVAAPLTAALFLPLLGVAVGGFAGAADRAWEETEVLREELAEQAERIQNVLACVASGVLVVDSQGRLTTYNRAAERILGVYEHKALGRVLAEVPGLEPLAELLARPSRAGDEEPGDPARADLRFRRPDGRTIYVGYAVSPLEDRAGRRLGQILVFQDVTLIRDYADRMLRQEQLAALGRMVSGIAHEFGNILGGARGLLSMARDESPEEAVESLPLVEETLDRALETVDNLLRFARGTPLHPSPGVRLEEVVERALRMLKSEIERSGLEVEVVVRPEAPAVEADAVQLEQVFINLIINAVHAVEEGEERRLRVEIASEGGGVVVRFEDSGPGLSPEARERVFEPFFTTKGSFAGGRAPGTGLGLSVALGVVEGHGGSLEAGSSESLGGASFVVRLPTAHPEGSAPN
ncbi:MAG: PAS domain S-box protein [Planctomycetota bacterium]|nr:MAG: PAS domain S-box protein [Planctomycetota bacterium]